MKQINQSSTQKIALISSGFIILGILGFSFSNTGQIWSEKINYQLAQITQNKLQANSFRNTKTQSETEKEPIKVERKNSLLGDIRTAQERINVRQYKLAIEKLKAVIVRRPNLEYPYILLGEIYLQTQNITQLNGLIDEIKIRFKDQDLVTILEIRKSIADNDFLTASEILNKFTPTEENLSEISADILFYYGTFSALQNDHETAQEVFKVLERLPVKKLEMIVSANGIKDNSAKKNAISPHIAQKVSDLVTIYQEFKQVSDGEDPHLFTLIGKKLAENNEWMLAQGFAEIALQEKSDYTDAWIVRGYTHYLRNNFEEALADFNAAYKLDPIRPETHYFLALTLTELDRDGEAALYYEKVLEQSNFNFETDLKWRLVEILIRQKKYEQVLIIYQELATETSELEKFISPLHQLIELAKRPDLALELSETLYDEYPQDTLAANLYAWSLIADDQIIKSLGVLNEALKQESDNPRTHLNLGLAKEKEQKHTEAAEHYKTAYDLGKTNRAYSAITNMAAEAYNRITVDIQHPTNLENNGRTQNSP
jgi:tetratricopeptide (TPR) repeat protein